MLWFFVCLFVFLPDRNNSRSLFDSLIDSLQIPLIGHTDNVSLFYIKPGAAPQGGTGRLPPSLRKRRKEKNKGRKRKEGEERKGKKRKREKTRGRKG